MALEESVLVGSGSKGQSWGFTSRSTARVRIQVETAGHGTHLRLNARLDIRFVQVLVSVFSNFSSRNPRPS